MSDINKTIEEEINILNIEEFIRFIRRRNKIFLLTSSLIFSILLINTVKKYFTQPIYVGSFSVLIKDPIDSLNPLRGNTVERLAFNQTYSELPTLVQYLKSQYVLDPVAKELGLSSNSLKGRIEITLDGKKPFVSRGILVVKVQGKNKIQNKIILEKLSKRYLSAASDQRQLRLKSGMEFLDKESPSLESKTFLIQKELEDFQKKYNLLDPFTEIKNVEDRKYGTQEKLKELKENIKKLEKIKYDLNLNKIETSGFSESLSDLGINVKGIDQDLINKYEILEADLANSKTKYKQDSIVIRNLKERLKILLPEIREKQISAIDLAIASNNSEIDISNKRLIEIKEELQLLPNLISEYERLTRKLDLSKKNLDGLTSAKENFQLQLAQKSLPWSIIEKPNVLPNPISPNIRQESIRHLLLALFLGLTAAYIKESCDRVFHNSEEVETEFKKLQVSTLGNIPFIKKVEENNEVEGDNVDDEEEEKIKLNQFLCSEAFRNLATSIRFLNPDNKISFSYVITSSQKGEGKTTVAAILANTFADLGKKVLLIDADLRRPNIHNFFEIDNMVGFSNLLTDKSLNLKDVILPSSNKNLSLITAGIRPPDPINLLSSERMSEINSGFDNSDFDYVIFDAPPSQGLSDAKIISNYCDSIFFIVSIDDVDKNMAKRTVKNLINSKTNIGLISNSRKELSLNQGYNYYSSYNQNLYAYYSEDKKPYSKKENKIKKNLKTKLITYFQSFLKWIDF